MGYLGRRIGLSQNQGDSNPGGADGAVGGGILDLFANGYFQRQGNIYNDPGIVLSGLIATGGVISDFTISGTVYRSHIFTSTGPFNVTSLSVDPNLDDNIDYLVVAGGGGGGEDSTTRGGGGGAGGLRSNFPTIPAGMKTPSFTASVQDYAITVGAGGAGASISGPGFINPGSNSSIGSVVVASGGGGGGNRLNDPAPGTYPSSPEMAGGSGGGGGSGPGSGVGGPTVNSPDPLSPQAQGNDGGNGNGSAPNYGAGGGGGAGAAGQGGTSSAGGNGGNGLQVLIAGPPASDQPVGTPGFAPGGGYFAGGGGGGAYESSGRGTGGDGGGGDGGNNPGETSSTAGTQSTGGGGGGNQGKSGGSGIVVVRYKIASVSTAKATGGLVSFYGGKTIHTFIGSGTFATTSDWSAADVEYVVIGGGGSGGLKQYLSGGGGAGAYRTGTTPIGAHPVSTTIQVGGGGVVNELGPAATPAAADGTPSYFGTPITAPGGGGGGTYEFPGDGRPGGSGGGGAGSSTPGSGSPATGASFPGTIGATPTTGWGHAGGDGEGSANYGGGGGGGAGGPGSDGTTSVGGDGGLGIQLPATFRNPASTVGAPGPTSPSVTGADTSGKYYVAGGGGGSMYPTGTPAAPGGGPGGPYAGGGAGGAGNSGGDGGTNTGGGGGGQERGPGPSTQAGRGGSGIVIVAYPT